MPGPPQRPTDLSTTGTIPVRVLLRRILSVAMRHRLAAIPALIATITMQVVTLISLEAQGLAIDVVRDQSMEDAPAPQWPFGLTPPQSWSGMQVILLVCGVILVAAIIAGAARYAVRVADEYFVQSCIVDLRTRLYDKLQRLGFRFFDAHDTGQIINRVTADTQSVRAFIQGVMIRSLVAAVTLIIFLIYMLREHFMLSIACLAIIPIQVIIMVRYSRRSKPMFLEQARLVDVLVKALQESIAGIRVIRAFGREKEQASRFDSRAADAKQQRIEIARWQGTHIPVIQAGSFLAMAVLLGYGGLLVIKGPEAGGIALGTLWVFRGLLGQLGAQAEALVQIIGSTPEALAGAERMFKLLDHPADIASPEDAIDEPIRGALEFRNVSFTYDPDTPVLNDISFAVEPGETIAIVGPTGSGKSTLLSLIPRFYDPTVGSILIDGIDNRERNLTSLRSSIAVVFQEPFLFSNTIRKNIAFANPKQPLPAIESAAEAAAAADFIEEADNGMETIVGERGVSLSGGQRQRLTIARALATDPPILILDDATGAVDAITETHIQNALEQASRERTTFIVAHRLSTLRRADRIIVMDHGTIVEIGSHEELMERPGHYRAAALIQLALEEKDLPNQLPSGREGA